jgi:hypothetical protein
MRFLYLYLYTLSPNLSDNTIKENSIMEGQIFGLLFLLLVGAAIIIPQVQRKREQKDK